jgi:hypothetical protein
VDAIAMALQSLTLTLPDDLWAKLQPLLTDRPDGLHRFVIQAIDHELQRCQLPSRKQAFWATVTAIRAEMEAEGIVIDPDQIWGDVRDRDPGREVENYWENTAVCRWPDCGNRDRKSANFGHPQPQ